MTEDMCASLLAEAQALPESRWQAVFNAEWPSGGCYTDDRAMASTDFGGSPDTDLPQLRTWVNSVVIPLLGDATVAPPRAEVLVFWPGMFFLGGCPTVAGPACAVLPATLTRTSVCTSTP